MGCSSVALSLQYLHLADNVIAQIVSHTQAHQTVLILSAVRCAVLLISPERISPASQQEA